MHYNHRENCGVCHQQVCSCPKNKTKTPILLTDQEVLDLARKMNGKKYFCSFFVRDKDIIHLVFLGSGLESADALLYEDWEKASPWLYRQHPVFPDYNVVHKNNVDLLNRELLRLSSIRAATTRVRQILTTRGGG